MKKVLKMFTLVLTLCVILSISVFAHSGRTDKSGGHKDNKNASGLGSYHYHCGGYPAHLHKNGVCPYDTPSVKPAENKKVAVPAVKEELPHTIATDIKAYINDNFIPCFSYKDSLYIVAEDLNNYGYDVVWNEKDRSLKISRNSEKTTIVLDETNSTKEHIIETTDIKVLLDKSDNSELTLDSYSIGGQTIIKLEDLEGTSDWNGDKRTIKFSSKI